MSCGRVVSAVALVALLSGTVGCSAASTSAAPAKSAASPSSSSAALSASSTPPAGSAALDVITVPGYTYTAPPAEMKKVAEAMDATGMITAMTSKGVRDGKGAEVGALVISQYNPKLTVRLDKLSPTKLADTTTRMAKAMIPGNPTVTTHVLSGADVRLIESPGSAMTIVYLRGGRLIEVAGPVTGPVLDFTAAYLKASIS